MKKYFVVLVIVTGFILNGCANTYHVIKIPRTTENLQAYRECQRTAVVSKGNDQSADQELFMKCMRTIDSTTDIVDEYPNPPAGCEQIENIAILSEWYMYYLCEEEGATPNN